MKRPASWSESRSITGWRAAIAILGRHIPQRGGDIQLRHRRGRRADALRLRRGALAYAGEQLPFEREDLVFGVEHLTFVVLQLRRSEALGVGQGLLALVIGRRQMLIGARDFDVVAEDVVEANLERLNARALALARLNLRDVLLAVLAEVAQLVQAGVEAGANRAAVGEVDRRLVGYCFQNQVGDVRQFVQAVMQR